MTTSWQTLGKYLLRAVCVFVGSLLIYVGLFLYEDEEGEYKSKVEEFWVRIHDQAKRSGGLFAAMLNQVAGLFEKSLEKAFGGKLISAQAAATSVSFSLAFAILCTIYRFIVLNGRSWHDVIYALVAVVCFACGCSRLLSRSLLARCASWVPLISLCLLSLVLFAASAGLFPVYGSQKPVLLECLEPIALMLFSMTSDTMCIALIRAAFRYIAQVMGRFLTFLATAALLLVAVMIIAVPYGFSGFRQGLPDPDLISKACNLLFLANLSSSALVGLFCVVLLALLVHQTLYPALAKLIYPFTRFDIFEKRKTLVSVGSAFLVYAFYGGKIPWSDLKDIVGK